MGVNDYHTLINHNSVNSKCAFIGAFFI